MKFPIFSFRLVAFAVFCSASFPPHSAHSQNEEEKTIPAPDLADWPDEIESILYPCSIDQSQQPMLVWTAKSREKRPLLVGLHTWSGDFTQGGGQALYAEWSVANDWHFIHPNFRGPNWTPDACGSDKAVQDIIDAVEYMKKTQNVDTERIYLVGVSGGGHAALLMAGRAPEIWAGVSAWAPISDVRAWWVQTETGRDSKYATHIEKAVGGRPDQGNEAENQCRLRSPITYLPNATHVNLDINAGVTDGREGGSVPFPHSLHAFNSVVLDADRLPVEFIESFYDHQQLPPEAIPAEPDLMYGEKQVIYRKSSANARVTIFNGGHEIIHHAALNWLASQRKSQPARWDVAPIHTLSVEDGESESGK